MSVDTIDDFALFGLGVWGDGEAWTRRGVSNFGGWRARGSGSGSWIHECDGGVAELCLGGDDFDAVAEDVGGLEGGGHVVVMWGCCCR